MKGKWGKELQIGDVYGGEVRVTLVGNARTHSWDDRFPAEEALRFFLAAVIKIAEHLHGGPRKTP